MWGQPGFGIESAMAAGGAGGGGKPGAGPVIFAAVVLMFASHGPAWADAGSSVQAARTEAPVAVAGLTAPGDRSRDAVIESLQREMSLLRREVRELRAERNRSWLNERRAAEVKALVRQVIADAETRASLLDSELLAGHNGKHFFLASADGRFLMTLKGQAQVRYIANFADDGATTAANFDEQMTGFQFRRLKLKFAGHAFDPRLSYKITLASTRDHNEVYLEEALIGYELADNLALAGGRTKAPFLREELISSSKQLTVERSLVNESFTAGFVEGLVVRWQPCEAVKLAAALTDGAGSGEETVAAGGAGADWNAADVDFALTARLDVKLAGDWGQWKDTSAGSGDQMGLFVGAALHYQKTETGFDATSLIPPGAPNLADDVVLWTVDGSLEILGLGVYAAVMGMHTEAPNNAGVLFVSGQPEDLNHYGFVIQAGYMVIPDTLEPFVRYEHLLIDDQVLPAVGGVSQEDDPNLLTVGFNYYVHKHGAKFTADLVYAFQSLGGAGAAFGVSDGLGLRADEVDQDGQLALRAQMQLLF